MPKAALPERHHIIGGGIAGLAAAVYLIRDAGMEGKNIHIYEQLGIAGGSLDGAGDAVSGYVIRGGRMFEEHFACTFDLLQSIPSATDPDLSVTEEIMAFNRVVRGYSNCRLVRDGRPAEDRYDLTLGSRDIFDVTRLMLRTERSVAGRSIDDWFKPSFFESNFWLMWSTMFSFQPWHDLTEMRRYLRRFIHLFPGFTRVAGILRTRFNQYDSLIAPVIAWLQDLNVEIDTGRQVVDVLIEGTPPERHVTSLAFADGESVEVSERDCVYITLGSMTDASVMGANDCAPDREDQEGGAWRLWRRLAAAQEGLGHPETFCGDTRKTAWHSFTVTMDGSDFFDFMENFSTNRTGTGGLITFADSGWILSIVLFHQPHFREQEHGTYTFWGYGLRGDRNGDFVRKPMWEATGNEIITELCGHLKLDAAQKAWFDDARVLPCRMPYITSQFMPRKPGDRPDIRPTGARNFAVLGQFCEQPRDCVFTVEYSVRSARTAVASLTGLVDPPPPVARTDLDPMVLMRAARVLIGK
ncbi:oleate hydratase [Phaeobacter sp. 22II1-1F12B]|uniref:oleate hydratase n=1 Tax=Phaeobacter sp. 22II1-1F12B TaxID=1317111 RepID=UPI000B525941|nr:oleate hydratase [Phaeobacter sp. 22II1-1F12B]OWU80888.1 oleate hydratase [Phaeobacter sp. 22II1-1F12B]